MSPRPGARISVDGKFFRRGHDRWLVKGISYGPFQKGLEVCDEVDRDLVGIKAAHFNALRVYEIPRLSFFERCAELEIDVFVSLPWEMNTDFLRSPALRQEVLDKVMRNVEGLSQAPALAGYFVANEIPTTLVRWMGVHRVREFLEELLATVRKVDPDRVLAYANYPSTEYLLPRNADFLSFNIYLEEREPYRQYLQRLQNLADGMPLVISEYGIDSFRAGEERQSELLSWLTDETYSAGTAGFFLFSYTDEWYNGGRSMDDWCFGLVRKDRSGKQALTEISRRMALMELPAIKVKHEPLVTVIVCTYNGHQTLPECLASLQALSYRRVEIVVVDDGSKPGIDKIAAVYAGVHYLRQDHGGLSVARNRGADYAHGDILVFTDDDCEVDVDWLTYLVDFLSDEEYDACGGPNLPPHTENVTARCIQLAPGNPTHVLINDITAEHLPGCNLAVRKAAFHAVGGFRNHYRVAGDDVDFCWRLQRAGYQLGFCPTAFVWHRRRKNLWSFVRQQIGYGKAEALLETDHPDKFTLIGGAHWKGVVYEPLSSRLPLSPVIYHGQYGKAPFQAMYQSRSPRHLWFKCLALSFYWSAWMVLFIILGLSHPGWWIIAGGMFVSSAMIAGECARNVCLVEPDGIRARITLAILFWVPSVARGAARWIRGGYHYDSRPLVREDVAFWNEEGLARESLLAGIIQNDGSHGRDILTRPSNDWANWDLVLENSFVTQFRLVTVTEFHDREQRLTRVAVQAHLRPVVKPVLVVALVALITFISLGLWWPFLIALLSITSAGTGVYFECRRRVKRHLFLISKVAKDLGLGPVEESEAVVANNAN